MVKLLYTTYISVDLAHYDIFRVNVGKGRISHMYAMVCPHIRGDNPRV